MRRRRWEYRERAVAHFNVQAEAMGASKEAPPAEAGTFRPNANGVNIGPPPLAALAALGLGMDM